MKRKNKNMNYKVIILAIVILIIILLLVFISFIIKDIGRYKNAKDNIKEYKIETILENIDTKSMVLDYNTFYTIENINNEVFDLIEKGAYQDLCALMGNEITYYKSENEIISLLKEYTTILNNSASENAHYLSYVYKYHDNTYLCKININDRLINLMLCLDSQKDEYKIVFIESWS